MAASVPLAPASSQVTSLPARRHCSELPASQRQVWTPVQDSVALLVTAQRRANTHLCPGLLRQVLHLVRPAQRYGPQLASFFECPLPRTCLLSETNSSLVSSGVSQPPKPHVLTVGCPLLFTVASCISCMPCWLPCSAWPSLDRHAGMGIWGLVLELRFSPATCKQSW